MKTQPKRTFPELSVDAQSIYKRLKKAAVNELVPYSELKEIIQRDPQRAGYSLVGTARRMLIRQDQILFEVIAGKGLRRMEDVAIVGVGAHAVKRIHRAARVGVRRMSCADYPKLPSKDKIKFNVNASLLGALDMMSRDRAFAVVREKAAQAKETLSKSNTLQLFQAQA